MRKTGSQKGRFFAEETTKLQKYPPYLERERERGGNEKVMYSIIILKKDLDNRWITAVETRWIEDGNSIKNVAKKNCSNEKFNSCARVCLNFVAVICYKATLNHSGLKILRAETPKANYCVQRRENAIPEFSRFGDLVPKLRREKKAKWEVSLIGIKNKWCGGENGRK